MGSSSGTLLLHNNEDEETTKNYTRITEVALNNGDKFQVGDTICTFKGETNYRYRYGYGYGYG